MHLDEVVPWGRSMAEYRAMFALTDFDLDGRILGCGDGPASFNAEMHALGMPVTSIDLVYQFSADEIRQRIEACYDPIMTQLRANPQRYVWEHFTDVDALGEARLGVMERFLADYPTGRLEGRYQNQSLPQLAFSDQTFDLALSSHFLLLYTEQLSLDFHLAAVTEMLRVAAEVRIFPIIDLACRPSTHLDAIIKMCKSRSCTVDIVDVKYEFQKGGSQMLRIMCE